MHALAKLEPVRSFSETNSAAGLPKKQRHPQCLITSKLSSAYRDLQDRPKNQSRISRVVDTILNGTGQVGCGLTNLQHIPMGISRIQEQALFTLTCRSDSLFSASRLVKRTSRHDQLLDRHYSFLIETRLTQLLEPSQLVTDTPSIQLRIVRMFNRQLRAPLCPLRALDSMQHSLHGLFGQ